jgi:hypothetical protein
MEVRNANFPYSFRFICFIFHPPSWLYSSRGMLNRADDVKSRGAMFIDTTPACLMNSKNAIFVSRGRSMLYVHTKSRYCSPVGARSYKTNNRFYFLPSASVQHFSYSTNSNEALVLAEILCVRSQGSSRAHGLVSFSFVRCIVWKIHVVMRSDVRANMYPTKNI